MGSFTLQSSSKVPRTLVLLLAGGKGSRLQKLTQNRAKPALPFLGQYRLIDFPLSNCMHSGLSDVWVIEQYQAHSINDHLANGRPWDMDRTYGGLQILPPIQGQVESGWHQGNADALWRSSRKIRAFDPELVLVLSADAVYKLDYREVIWAHIENKAEVTMVTSKMAREQASRFGNVQTTQRHRVTEFAYKPDQPLAGRKTSDDRSQEDTVAQVTCEIFVYDAKVLLQVLEQLIEKKPESKSEAALEDFGHDLLPEFVNRGRAYSFDLQASRFGHYWRDVGTVESYFEANMEFLTSPPFDLDDKAWPILSRFAPLGASRIGFGAQVQDSLVSSGCRIEGVVTKSILGAGVHIEKGASVHNSILLSNAVVRTGTQIKNAIIDEEKIVDEDAILEGISII